MQTPELSFLYMEDDASSRQIMEILLCTVLGYSQVTIYEDSKNFLERLDALPTIPNVILLDIHMKPLNGYEMLKLIREQNKFDTAKVVALTASVMSNEVEELRNAGFDSVIGKPVHPTTFPDLLNSILNGKSVWNITWE